MENKEKIVLANTTSSLDVLKGLMNDSNARVRRAVARNLNSSKEILNVLVFDPVMNVSFMAHSNSNCTIQREFGDNKHPCVTCLDNEAHMDCNSCKKIL